MVYYTKSLRPCHILTEKGKENFRSFLERKADEILYRHEHPIRWFCHKIAEYFKELISR